MKMLKTAIIITFCVTMLAGCTYNWETKFRYDCNATKMAISKIYLPPLSICVQDKRQISDKKILAEYDVVLHHYRTVSDKEPSSAIKEAFCKELMCQGHINNEDSPIRINIVINEICITWLFRWSFNEGSNYGVINADVSILNKGKTIYSTNIITMIKDSEVAYGTNIGTPLLYEFTQDVLSDREFLNALSTIK
jgi:hypothetical protein